MGKAHVPEPIDPVAQREFTVDYLTTLTARVAAGEIEVCLLVCKEGGDYEVTSFGDTADNELEVLGVVYDEIFASNDGEITAEQLGPEDDTEMQ